VTKKKGLRHRHKLKIKFFLCFMKSSLINLFKNLAFYYSRPIVRYVKQMEQHALNNVDSCDTKGTFETSGVILE
jgi:hypothetical protein